MLFHVNKKDFSAAIISVIKALPTRTTLPSLEGIFFDAKKDGLHLKCSDLMLQKECIVPCMVEEEGQSIIPGKFFSELVRKLPEGDVTVSISGKDINIVCGRVNTVLQTMDFDEFPEMRFDDNSFSVKMKNEECKSIINHTVFATSIDDSKPILTGVLFEINDGNITAVATDAYQFAMRKQKVEQSTKEKQQIVIPGKALTEISHMMDETENDAELTFSRTHIRVDIGNTILTARLLDGTYIDYKRIIPQEYKTRILINKNSLIESIERAQLVSREGGNNVILHFTDNMLRISSTSLVGTFEENIDAQINGEDIDIAFNPKYLLNVLKNADDETVCIDLVSEISPCVVKPLQGDGYYYLVVPVRIYS